MIFAVGVLVSAGVRAHCHVPFLGLASDHSLPIRWNDLSFFIHINDKV